MSPTLQPTQQASSIRHLQKGDAFSIEKVQMIDGQSGWGIASASDHNDHVLITHDGGQSWQDVTPPVPVPAINGHPLRSISFFLDRINAWASFYPENEPSNEPLPIWYTQDGGKIWSVSQPIGPNQFTEIYSPVDLYFINQKSGWLMLGHGAAAGSAPISIYQTRDGGNTWEQILEMLSPQSGSVDTCCQSGMEFFDAANGVITTSYGPDPYPHVNWTRDGGDSWLRQDLPVPDGITQDASCGTSSPSIVGSKRLYLLMECQIPTTASGVPINYLYRTDNFGESWDVVALPEPEKEHGAWHYNRRDRQIQFSSPENGWLFIYDFYENGDGQQTQTLTNLFNTHDGGETWQPLGKVFWEGSFSFSDELHGWAVARQGKEVALVATIDGGKTWQMIKPGIKE